jgi:putative transposase
MPWKETCAVELRESLVLSVLAKEAPFAELCRRAGVARKTGYKWVARFQQEGRAGLGDHSRARHSQEDRVDEHIRELIIKTRRAHPTWGVKKLLPYLAKRHPEKKLPCQSTAGDILHQAGLTRPQKRHRRQVGAINGGSTPDHPNHTWTTDFKGEFRLCNGAMCYPLTVADAFSRYLLCVDGKLGTHVKGVMESYRRLFEIYGMPERIRSDNGTPFAGIGLARLSQLSVWFMQRGIIVEHIRPGRPTENGSHERMHRTLKAETTRPPGSNMSDQQRRFDVFRPLFNHERPHEALGQVTPASVYQPSPRPFAGDAFEEDIYPGHWERRRLSNRGDIKWRGNRLFIADPLRGCVVGLVEVEEDLWQLHYLRTLVALIDFRGRRPTVRDPLRHPLAAPASTPG